MVQTDLRGTAGTGMNSSLAGAAWLLRIGHWGNGVPRGVRVRTVALCMTLALAAFAAGYFLEAMAITMQQVLRMPTQMRTVILVQLHVLMPMQVQRQQGLLRMAPATAWSPACRLTRSPTSSAAPGAWPPGAAPGAGKPRWGQRAWEAPSEAAKPSMAVRGCRSGRCKAPPRQGA